MNSRDPKITALEFNECITRHDVEALSRLMTEDHTFVDREGTTEKSREKMTRSWEEFFKMFPKYRNFFIRVESKDDTVIMVGYAYWSENNTHDPAIWTADIKDDLVAQWRIYYDTAENWKTLGIA